MQPEVMGKETEVIGCTASEVNGKDLVASTDETEIVYTRTGNQQYEVLKNLKLNHIEPEVNWYVNQKCVWALWGGGGLERQLTAKQSKKWAQIESGRETGMPSI